jgi:hypothetical protein
MDDRAHEAESLMRSQVIGRTSLGLIQLVLLFGLLAGCGSDKGERAEPSDSEMEARLAKLRSVPYTSVTDQPVGEVESGVTVHDAARAFPGYNLFCARTVPEVLLLDMSGKVVHEWRFAFEEDADICEHAILFANGDVVIVDKFKRLLRLDWHSNIIWTTPLVTHHDVCPSPDNKLYAISLEGRKHRGLVVRFPVVVTLNARGTPIGKWSAYDNLDEIKQVFDQRSFLDTILDSLLARHDQLEAYDMLLDRTETILREDMKVQYDHFHMNTVSILPDTPLAGTDPAFAPGNLLICFRNVNQVAILERETKAVLWAWGEGHLEWPHHPTMLENGNILVFDNGVVRGYSRVVELDPVTEAIVWECVADPPEAFYTYGKGSAQRLPNGNTLICEGDRGRVFEVTPEGETVWEWYNPRTEKDRRVQVYRMTRYTAEHIEPLLSMQ